MAKSKVTLKEMMKELKIIKKLVLKDLQIDEKDVKLNTEKLEFNKKPIKESDRIFDDLREWTIHIWEECEHKKIISTKKEFVYHCKLLKKGCKFEYCPLNIKR